jgi:hypothetical protein
MFHFKKEVFCMSSKTSPQRRSFFVKLVQFSSLVPLAGLTLNASAAKNDAIRKALKYQDTPNAGKDCATCIQFVPDKKGCKIMPGDDEISATGWCSAYIEKK